MTDGIDETMSALRVIASEVADLVSAASDIASDFSDIKLILAKQGTQLAEMNRQASAALGAIWQRIYEPETIRVELDAIKVRVALLESRL